MSNPSNPSPATHWQSLLPAAMVGTEKMAFSAPALSGPVGALLAQIEAQAAQPALALLQMAGVLAVCERAARQGQASAASAPNNAAPRNRASAASQRPAAQPALGAGRSAAPAAD